MDSKPLSPQVHLLVSPFPDPTLSWLLFSGLAEGTPPLPLSLQILSQVQNSGSTCPQDDCKWLCHFCQALTRGKRTAEGCNVLSHKTSSCRDLNSNQDAFVLAFVLTIHPTRIACVFAPGFGIFVSTGQLGHGSSHTLGCAGPCSLWVCIIPTGSCFDWGPRICFSSWN